MVESESGMWVMGVKKMLLILLKQGSSPQSVGVLVEAFPVKRIHIVLFPNTSLVREETMAKARFPVEMQQTIKDSSCLLDLSQEQPTPDAAFQVP